MGKTNFKDLIASVEEEARQAGPEAVAELEALRARFAIGRQLRQLRQLNGLTQGQLAELSGIGQSEISKIERGEANATTETLRALGAPLNAHPALVDDDGVAVGRQPALA